MTRIPLDLYIEIEAADGSRYKLDANQPAGSRPQNLSFRTKIGDGFGDASFQLPRRVDLDYPDLALGNNVVITAADGTIVYEGRIAALPRELSGAHTIGVTVTGHMAHAKDRKFSQIYADRDTGAWQGPPLNRQAGLLAIPVDLASVPAWSRDQGGLVAALPNQALGAQVISETWYAAPPGLTVAKIGYKGADTSMPGGWEAAAFFLSDTDAGGGITTTSATFDDTLRVATPTTARRYVTVRVYSNGTAATPAAGANRRLSKVAMYGDHELTLRPGDPAEPDGVYGSDVIRDIAARYCPELDTSGVQDTSYVIQHLAFRDRTYPFDAFLEINKFHLWHLGVWENRTLHFRPYDLTDYDWEIRTDDPGTTFQWQGPSTEDLFNGIEVTYTDLLTNQGNVLTPDDYDELRDESTENPWNQHGRAHWDDFTISRPVLLADALQIARARLADRNRPRTPGTLTVRGYIRDRAGNEQPVSKVRAGQTVSITNFNDAIRLIVETDHNDGDKSVRIAVDRPFALLEAIMDRQQNALQAAGLA